jgi:acyl dehydratase
MSGMNQGLRDGVGLYLDDLRSASVTSDTYLIEAARIKEFAAEFDPQPFHLDESAAEKSVFKGLAASGWYTAGINRYGVEDARALRERNSEPLGPEFCSGRCEATAEA